MNHPLTPADYLCVIALGLLGDGLDHPALSRVTRDANYRAQVEAVAEVLRIL